MFLKIQLSSRGTERALERDFDSFTLAGLFCVFLKPLLLVSSAVKQSKDGKTTKRFHPSLM